jgi:4-diphosphocytidyl-2-C-methyl-D-erythritol kinase
VVLRAPAKVNLHLEIKGMRSDGYHEILSVVHSVALFDRVRLRSLKEKNALRVWCDPALTRGTNIAAAAVQAFRKSCEIETGVEVQIKKGIPLGAGLGGGSSDAAAVLLGLNETFGFPLSGRKLHELACELGSDIPFFLRGPAALLSGRGEIIRDIQPRQDFLLVLVYPRFAISTREAYRWFDGDANGASRESRSAEDLKFEYEKKPPDSWSFANSFQSTIERRYPLIKEIAAELKHAGAHLSSLSGSGSSVFGIFSDMGTARSAARRMRSHHAHVWVVAPLKNGGSAD